MSQEAETARKILPFDVIPASRPMSAIPAFCTIEEIKVLVLARLRELLLRFGASYFTVDDFTAVLDLLMAPGFPAWRRPDSLLGELEREGKVAIVDFSPADIYRIVDEPSPNLQTRS